MKSCYSHMLSRVWAMSPLDFLALGAFDGNHGICFDDSFGSVGDYE